MKKTVLALACLFSCAAFSPAEAAWQPQLAVGLVAGQEVLVVLPGETMEETGALIRHRHRSRSISIFP